MSMLLPNLEVNEHVFFALNEQVDASIENSIVNTKRAVNWCAIERFHFS